MADADLDVVIRQFAKQQNKHLISAVKSRKAHYTGLAGKAKTPEAKAKFKHMAQQAEMQGSAATKRLQTSADNAADSYARAMRQAAENVPVVKVAVKKATVKKAPAKKKAGAKKHKKSSS
jgi:hypothetical protein